MNQIIKPGNAVNPNQLIGTIKGPKAAVHRASNHEAKQALEAMKLVTAVMGPQSNYPFSHTLQYLLAHTEPANEALGAPGLYSGLRMYTPAGYTRVPNITEPDFQRHLKRFAAATFMSYCTNSAGDVAHVIGLRMRQKPLPEASIRSYAEGLIAGLETRR